MKRIIFIIILISMHYLLQGQTEGLRTNGDCIAVVKEADRLFEDGIYDKCIITLENLLGTCDLPKIEKEHSMELLAKAYAETDEPDKADAAVNILLKNFPHYELKEEVNSELYNRIVRKYVIHPRFSVGIRNTVDWISFRTTKVYSVLEGLDYSVPYGIEDLGLFHGFSFSYYGWAEYEFDRGVSLNADLIFRSIKINRDINKDPGFRLNFNETDNYMEIPVYLKKYFQPWKNVLPYITTGLGWLRMASAKGNATISYTKDDLITGKNMDFYASANDINMMELRNRNTFEWIAGFGIGYKLKNLRLFLDARYYRGLNSFNNVKNYLANEMLVNDFFYRDNAVRINQFELGASISYTLFNSVKKAK
jgi:hypothetical protein